LTFVHRSYSFPKVLTLGVPTTPFALIDAESMEKTHRAWLRLLVGIATSDFLARVAGGPRRCPVIRRLLWHACGRGRSEPSSPLIGREA
jgi:hypothetical protein